MVRPRFDTLVLMVNFKGWGKENEFSQWGVIIWTEVQGGVCAEIWRALVKRVVGMGVG